MEVVIAWHEEYLEYCRDRRLSVEDDPAEQAALKLRLAGLMAEYNRLTRSGEHEEAARLVQWLVLPTHFLLVDPDSGRLFECIQPEEGGVLRVVSGYRPEGGD